MFAPIVVYLGLATLSFVVHHCMLYGSTSGDPVAHIWAGDWTPFVFCLLFATSSRRWCWTLATRTMHIVFGVTQCARCIVHTAPVRGSLLGADLLGFAKHLRAGQIIIRIHMSHWQ